MYVCGRKGTVVDGHDYILQAIKDGAVAVICEELPARVTGEVDFLMVANSAVALELCQLIFMRIHRLN